MTPITIAAIEAEIASEHYFTAADGVNETDKWPNVVPPDSPLYALTFCVLVLKKGDGIPVHGHSTERDPELARARARNRALNRAGDLLGLGISASA